MRFIATTILIALLSGCIPYPIYKTLQPGATAMVTSPDGKRITGATVTLISSAYPYGREKFRVSAVSRNGYARFFKVKDFRIEATMLHGAESYFWNWCVKAEGFKTIETAYRGQSEFDRQPTFKMEPGESAPCREPTY